ncbi:MAG: hypothetical protein M1131_02710, partial [Actinobacteria bacterium]|nr:hypothetical protein [Actinomycetota bacterium]
MARMHRWSTHRWSIFSILLVLIITPINSTLIRARPDRVTANSVTVENTEQISTTPINSSSTQGSVYTPLTPYRIVDTRSGATDPSTYAGDTLGANSTLNVQVSGVSGPQGQSVPSGASAVVLT